MPLLKKDDHVGIICCSNAQPLSHYNMINTLLECLRNLGLHPHCSDLIYEKHSALSGTAKEKANAFMTLYKDPQIKALFDISGGDLANEVLPYLDYDAIANTPKPVFGYSDLTTLVNALYAKTGMPTYLYQIRNLIGTSSEMQISHFVHSLLEDAPDLYDFPYSFVQGDHLEGIVIGGNIRCFLKLAGTPYMPDFTDKILFLESYGGGVPQMITYLNQYAQMGVFRKIKGIILGTYTTMEKEQYTPTIEELVMTIVDNPTLPIVKTNAIGHGPDSQCLVIGRHIKCTTY